MPREAFAMRLLKCPIEPTTLLVKLTMQVPNHRNATTKKRQTVMILLALSKVSLCFIYVHP